MKKAVGTPPGEPTLYPDLTPTEAQEIADVQAAIADEVKKAKPPSIGEMVEALVRDKEGDPTLLNDVMARRSALNG